MIVERVFVGIVILLSLSSFLISLLTITLIFIRIRPLTTNVPILLICNTYVTLIGSSFMTLLITCYGLYADLYQSVSVNDYYCELRSYINYIFICAFYYSCALQAAFRLFRVVFPKQKILQTSRVLTAAAIIQWIIPILYILAYLLNQDFEYHPEINSCWLSFKNIRALSIAMAFVYGTPLILVSFTYFWIIRYLRQTITEVVRQVANKRDLVIVKRIIILVLINMGIGIPTAFLLIIYMITNSLTSLAYHIQALSLTTGLFVESIALGFISPQIRNVFKRNRRQVNPMTIMENGTQRPLPMRTYYN